MGDLRATVHSRRRDELKGMASDMLTLIQNLRNTVQEDRERIKEACQKIDMGDAFSAKEILKKVTSWYTLD